MYVKCMKLLHILRISSFVYFYNLVGPVNDLLSILHTKGFILHEVILSQRNRGPLPSNVKIYNTFKQIVKISYL